MTEREAFEVWAKKAGWPHHFTSCNTKDPNAYSQESWEAWQAARAQPAQAVPVLSDGELCDIGVEHGRATLVDGYDCGTLWFDGDLRPDYRAVEAAVRAKMGAGVPVLTDAEIDALYAKSDLEADPGSDYGCGFYSGARWAEQAVRAKLGVAVPMPPEDWHVFNSGAEVASGLTWAEALDYMTPSRIERGWSAVCVADKSNIGIVGKEGA